MTPDQVRSEGLEDMGAVAGSDWRFADGGLDVSEVEAVLARLSGAGGAAVGACVLDSDVAVVMAAERGRTTARVVVNAAAARDLGLEIASDAEAFSGWTANSPRTLSAAEVRDVLAREWVFAEEGVDELLERAGLPRPLDPAELPHVAADEIGAGDLRGYEAPLDWMRQSFFLGDQELAWRDARFVPGRGEGFLGIWDRERPTEPVTRFPETSSGQGRLLEELDRLQEPLLRELLAATELEGFRRPLLAGVLQIAQREIPYQHARYVPGHGEGFVGVWDREAGPEPIERFADSRSGEQDASLLAYRLLFEHLAARTNLPGTRVHLPSWLLTEEDENGGWTPSMREPPGRWFLYRLVEGPEEYGLSAELGFICEGSFPSAAAAQAYAHRFGAEGEWREVPDDVFRNLLETARWVAALAH